MLLLMEKHKNVCTIQQPCRTSKLYFNPVFQLVDLLGTSDHTGSSVREVVQKWTYPASSSDEISCSICCVYDDSAASFRIASLYMYTYHALARLVSDPVIS